MRVPTGPRRLAWAIGCALAALAGIFIAPDVGVAHINLTLLIVNAYAAAMIGRLRSFPLTFLGALILGLADAYWLAYQPQGNQYVSQLRFGIPVILLFVVLVFMAPARLRGTVTGQTREVVPMPSWRTALIVAGSVVAGALVLTTLLGEADALRASKVMALAVIALSLVPIVGFGGMAVLCPMSFAGIGALVFSHHAPGGEPWVLLFSALVAGAVGVLVALPILRLSGIELALATAAFAVALDRWLFLLNPIDVGPWTIRLFGFGSTPVAPVDIPGVEPGDRDAQLVLLAAAFAVLYMVVVAVRRSGFGMRLLALKSSPAAAATLGLSLTRAATRSSSRCPRRWPASAGRCTAARSGRSAPRRSRSSRACRCSCSRSWAGSRRPRARSSPGSCSAALPIAIATWPFFLNPNRVLPGLMGIGLGRNPNGAVTDLAEAYRPVAAVRGVLIAVLGAGVAVLALHNAGVVTSWGLVFALAVLAIAAPAAAGAVLGRRARAAGPDDQQSCRSSARASTVPSPRTRWRASTRSWRCQGCRDEPGGARSARRDRELRWQPRARRGGPRRRGRRGDRPHRPERRGQDDAVQRRVRPATARAGKRAPRRPRRHPPRAAPASRASGWPARSSDSSCSACCP